MSDMKFSQTRITIEHYRETILISGEMTRTVSHPADENASTDGRKSTAIGDQILQGQFDSADPGSSNKTETEK